MKKFALGLSLVILLTGITLYSGNKSEIEGFLADTNPNISDEATSDVERYIINVNESGTIHASWDKGYLNFSEMYKSADLIVTGRVISVTPELRHDLVFTKQHFKINEVFKGKSNGQISILLMGGEVHGVKTPSIEDAQLMSTLEEYVLFLEYTPEGHYLIMGGNQGYSKVKDGKYFLINLEKNKLRSINELKD